MDEEYLIFWWLRIALVQNCGYEDLWSLYSNFFNHFVPDVDGRKIIQKKINFWLDAVLVQNCMYKGVAKHVFGQFLQKQPCQKLIQYIDRIYIAHITFQTLCT